MRDEELDKAFVAELVEQPKQLDKLTRVVLILSFVVPVLYAIGLKFFLGSEASTSAVWFIVAAFLSWLLSLLLSLFGLISGKGKAGPITMQPDGAGVRGMPGVFKRFTMPALATNDGCLLAPPFFALQAFALQVLLSSVRDSQVCHQCRHPATSY